MKIFGYHTKKSNNRKFYEMTKICEKFNQKMKYSTISTTNTLFLQDNVSMTKLLRVYKPSWH